jgi:FMN phosphatase YigB (HAD superfamily)
MIRAVLLDLDDTLVVEEAAAQATFTATAAIAAGPALDALAGRYALALVTNGAPCRSARSSRPRGWPVASRT